MRGSLLRELLGALFIVQPGICWIEAGQAPGAALTQEVPALIKVDLDLPQSSPLLLCQAAFLGEEHQLLFFVYKIFDVIQNVAVVTVHDVAAVHKHLLMLLALSRAFALRARNLPYS